MARFSLDERRRTIAEAVISVIAKEGLEAATVRRIAAELGCSTTVITRYFSDKDDLLLWAYRTFHDFSREAWRATGDDAASLVAFVTSMGAIDPPRCALWRTYVAVWDKSLHDPAFEAELTSWIDEALSVISDFIRRIAPDSPDPDRSAKRLLALVQGVSIQVLFAPKSWPAEAIRDVIASEVDLVLCLGQSKPGGASREVDPSGS